MGREVQGGKGRSTSPSIGPPKEMAEIRGVGQKIIAAKVAGKEKTMNHHLERAKKWAEGAGNASEEKRSIAVNFAIAHALIAIAEQIEKGIDVDTDRPNIQAVKIIAKS